MRALFTAREALRAAKTLADCLTYYSYNLRQECTDSNNLCSACEGKELLRAKVPGIQALLGAAIAEVQVKIDTDMPYAQAAVRRKKLNKTTEALPRGARRLLNKAPIGARGLDKLSSQRSYEKQRKTKR